MRLFIYLKKDYIFTDFITDLYNMRLEYPPKKKKQMIL